MKPIQTLCAVAALFVAVAASAQTLSITATSAAVGTATANINGVVTATNLVNDVTNSVQVTVFWGGSDGGTLSYNWANYKTHGTALTNNQTFSVGISNLTAGTILYYRARAQDLTGEAWLSASKTLTTVTQSAWAPDAAYRTGLSTNLRYIQWGTVTNTLYITNGIIKGVSTP